MERVVTARLAALAELSSRASGNHLLAALPGDCYGLLESDLQQASLPQGWLCYGPGDPIEQIYFPQTGMISLLVAIGDGEMVETASVGREGAVGLQAGLGGRLSFTRAIVQIAGKFSIIAASRFEHAVNRSPPLRDLIVRYMEIQWAEAQQNAACNASHDAASRLCRWLLQCSDCIGSDQLALTQEFLADMLGVRRTTVTLLAQHLQKQGVLRYSRGRITIMDRTRLGACACECHAAVKQQNLSREPGAKI